MSRRRDPHLDDLLAIFYRGRRYRWLRRVDEDAWAAGLLGVARAVHTLDREAPRGMQVSFLCRSFCWGVMQHKKRQAKRVQIGAHLDAVSRTDGDPVHERIGDTAQGPDAVALDRVTLAEARTALSPRQWEAFVALAEGHTEAEIGARSGVSKQAVHLWIAAGRRAVGAPAAVRGR